MDHSDDQSDFAPDRDLTLQQDLMLLKIMAFDNSWTDEEYERQEKEIRENYFRKYQSEDF